MLQKQIVTEAELAGLARDFRLKSGKKKAEAARELKVKRPTIQLAEGTPGQSLTKLRIRMIEKYSTYQVIGPVFLLKKK